MPQPVGRLSVFAVFESRPPCGVPSGSQRKAPRRGRGFKVDRVRHLKAPVSPSPPIPLFTPPLTLVQKIALTAIVDQAYNLNERPLLHGPTARPPFGSRFTSVVLLLDAGLHPPG